MTLDDIIEESEEKLDSREDTPEEVQTETVNIPICVTAEIEVVPDEEASVERANFRAAQLEGAVHRMSTFGRAHVPDAAMETVRTKARELENEGS